MFDVVLYQPEIPGNTGNIIRLAANCGCRLHLIKPLGFELDDKRMKRAGLDYHEYASMIVHEDWETFRARYPDRRLFAMTTKGSRIHADIAFEAGDMFVFGPETRGLPEEIRAQFAPERRLRLPMQADSRSMNLSNAVAATVFEAWRQHGFAGGV